MSGVRSSCETLAKNCDLRSSSSRSFSAWRAMVAVRSATIRSSCRRRIRWRAPHARNSPKAAAQASAAQSSRNQPVSKKRGTTSTGIVAAGLQPPSGPAAITSKRYLPGGTCVNEASRRLPASIQSRS